MYWQIKSYRSFFVFLVMPLFLIACGGGGSSDSGNSNSSGASGNPQPVPALSQDTAFAFVQRNLAVETQAKTESFQKAVSGQNGRYPLDLVSPYQFNPGAKLITRSSLNVDAIDTDVLTNYFNSSDYDVKDLNVSPDGKFLIFAAHGPNNHPTDYTWNIYEYNFATKTIRRIIEDDVIANAGQDTNPTYALDGTIVFSSDRSAGNPNSPVDNIVDEEQKPFCYKVGPDEKPSLLHSMSNQGENILQLTYGRNHDTKPITLKDGRIAFVRWTRTYSLLPNCPAASTTDGSVQKPAFSEFNDVFNMDYPKGLDLPPQWSQEKLCALAQTTPMGKVVASNHYRILRITADGEELDQLYKTVTLLGSDESFIEPNQLIQVEDGKLVTVLQHQYNGFMGGNVLQLQSPQNPVADKVFGNFSPSTMVADKVDLYPNQQSINGWYSAVWPYRDGTGRMLVSWSQCAATQNGVSSFCTDGNNEGDVNSQYGIWVVNPQEGSRLPIVRAKTEMLYSDVAISQPHNGLDFPYEPYDSDFVDDLDTSRMICTEPVNTPPVANAGPDQEVLIGQTITLDGSGSTDIDGDALTYHWLITSPSETKAVLVNEQTVSPKITIKEHGTYVIQLVVNDGKIDSLPDTVSLEVGNRKPVANAGVDQAGLPGNEFQLNGSSSSDADGDSLTYRWRVVTAPENSAAQLLGADAVKPTFIPDQYGVYTIELIVNDGYVDSDADTMVIDTSNAAPIANAGPDQQVMIGQTVTLNGSGSVDPDGDALAYHWTIISPSNTTAVLSSNSIVMPTLVIAEHGTYTIQLAVSDGKFESTDSVNLVVVNNKPVANAGADQKAEPGNHVQLDGSLSRDQDGDALTYRWRIVSAPANSAAALIGSTTLIPMFTPDEYGMYTIELVVNDGYVDSDADLVVIDARNARPIANAGPDQTVKVGQTVNLNGSASTDADGDPLTYMWTITSPSDSVAVITNNTSAMPSIDIVEHGTYVIQLVVNDGKIDSFPDTVSLTVENTKPVANAGVDQVANPGSQVQLDGSLSSDEDGDQLTYRWRIVSAPEGSAAELVGADSVNPTISTDQYGMYTVELVVNDGYVDSDADTMVIDASNAAPVANAGNDQDVYIDHTVTLDGSKSNDPDNDPITYLWTIVSPSNTTTTIANNTAVMPTVTIREHGTYVVQLVVNDGKVNSEPDTVTLTVVNSKPVANAGPDQSGNAGDEFTLDGSLSHDADEDPLTYRWRIVTAPQNSAAELVGADLVKPTFTPDQYGVYTIELVVNDGKVDSNADTMTIDTSNAAPVANAGPDQHVSMNQLVTLDGSSSHDEDGDALTYRWTIISPANTEAVLSDSSAVMPTLTILEHGVYVVQLIVNDGKVDSVADTVNLEVGNVKPVANAGVDQNNDPGNPIQLDGSLSSDVDGDLLSYSWRIVSAPDNSVATIVNANSVNPTITPDQYGIYTIELVVNDGMLNSDPDIMVINTLNSRPVADAGRDHAVRVNDLARLDGSGSSDADGDPLTYSWSVLSKPADSNASLDDPLIVGPGITIDKAGVYVLQLIVNDGIQNSEPDTVVVSTINVRPIAEAGTPQTKYVGDKVSLNGSESYDPDGDNINYLWALTTKPAGSTATLVNSAAVNPEFTADKEGTYIAQLIVNDGVLDSEPDTVTIKIEQPVCDISSATKRTLPVIIRDFDTRHPDFETYDGIEYGIVKKDLGYLDEGGKPVYNKESVDSKTTTSKHYFDQWYRDVPGVNMTIPYSLQMTRQAGSTVWSYVNADFFPINGQGFGNYVNDRNYHFTLEAHLEFDYIGGEVFTFKGDDDLWVFINGKLAIDIGGVHGVEQRTINLDQKASELGIQKGQTYRFDLFFAERHTWKSNFMFQTNINLECVPGQE